MRAADPPAVDQPTSSRSGSAGPAVSPSEPSVGSRAAASSTANAEIARRGRGQEWVAGPVRPDTARQR